MYVFNVICSYSSESGLVQDIFDVEVKQLMEASVLFNIFSCLSTARLSQLEKISLCLKLEGDIEAPAWLMSTNGKYFFGTK